MLWHLTFSHEAALQSQKNRKNIASDSRRYEWPHGKCSACNLKWGMSHHLSPSLSHYTSTAHACFGICVRVLVSKKRDCVLMVIYCSLRVWIDYIFDDRETVIWPCKILWGSLSLKHWMSLCLVYVCRWFQEYLCAREVSSNLLMYTQRGYTITFQTQTHTP